MTDQELINKLNNAQELVKDNIVLSVLLAMAAERIALLSKENGV